MWEPVQGPDGTVNLSRVPAQPGSGCRKYRGQPLEADLPGQRGALSGPVPIFIIKATFLEFLGFQALITRGSKCQRKILI